MFSARHDLFEETLEMGIVAVFCLAMSRRLHHNIDRHFLWTAGFEL